MYELRVQIREFKFLADPGSQENEEKVRDEISEGNKGIFRGYMNISPGKILLALLSFQYFSLF